MKLRRFTPDGLQAFKEFLSQCRREPDTEVPPGMLKNNSLTEIVRPGVEIALNHFETKGEAATYLDTVLRPLPQEELRTDAGLWSWLSLLYFDSICPCDRHHRVVRNDYHYILEPNNVRHFYRHLLFISWRVLKLAPIHNRLFLRSPISTLDKVTTEVMKRLFLTRIPAVFEVLDRVYWDNSRNRPRAGITGSNVQSGDLTHRFTARIRQLEKTYDLMSLNADQLLDLLGDEFAFGRPKVRQLQLEEMSP